MLVLVSPGFVLPDGVIPDNWGLIERAIRAGVVVNTVNKGFLYTADVMPDIEAPPQGSTPVPPIDSAVGDYQKEEGTYRMQAQFDSGQVLAAMAANTGGTYFHNRNDLDGGIRRALAAPTVSYVLGFVPQNPMTDGKFRDCRW